MSQKYTHPEYGTVTLHFNSKLAGRIGGSNNCVTLDAKNICIASNFIFGLTLAHEFGHVMEARRLGWKYLLHIARSFLSYGYVNSKMEKAADDFMKANGHKFADVYANN